MRTLKFNPGFQTDDEAIENFVVRTYQLEKIVDALTASASSDAPPPRFLVTAPRGAGKTTLCRRVLAEVRRDAMLSAYWQPIFLSEESYTVTTVGEFFLEALSQLKEQEPEAKLERAHRHAVSSTTEDELVDRSIGALRSYGAETGKRLFIIVENFHMILDDQLARGGRSAADALLGALQNDRLFGVLATSVARAHDDDEHVVPDHYDRIDLRPLSLEECRDLWEFLTGNEVPSEKIRPLQILTGGSPRLLHILAEFMKTPSLRDLMGNLNLLIDQNTEYFKSQLDVLPTIERKVFAALLEIWDPSTAKQIAEVARVNTNTASSMLARLMDRGAVLREDGPQGRTAIYYASERLFNIYYLMRRRSHPSSRVKALVTFMVEYYDQKELVDTTAKLVREACGIDPSRRSDYHSTFDAIMSRSSEAVRAEILRSTPSEFIQSFRQDQRQSRENTYALTERDTISNAHGRLSELIDRIESAADEGDLVRAQALILEAIELKPEMAELWTRLAFVEHERDRPDAAIEAAQRARSLDPTDPWTYSVLALCLDELGKKQEAEDAHRAALDLDPGHEPALAAIGSILEERGDVAGAAKVYAAADAAHKLTDLTRASFGQLLARMERFEQAEAVLRFGSDDFDNVVTRHALVEFLEARGRQDEGVRFLETVAEKDHRWEAFADLGNYFLVRTSNGPAARDALRTAIEMGGANPIVYSRLATALIASDAPRDQVSAIAVEMTGRFPEDAQAWTLAGLIYVDLNQEAEAEAAYRNALERDAGEVALIPLARLLQRRKDRNAEAEQLLRQAVASANGRFRCGPSKELAELLIHRGEEAEAENVLSGAIAANDRCTCCLVLQGDICRRRGATAAAEESYRAALSVDDFDIAALTGLAQMSADKEAASLVQRAIEADRDDPRVLLTRAKLGVGTIEDQKRDAQMALERRPDFVEAHLFLAPLEAGEGNLKLAVHHLEQALEQLPSQRELIPYFVSSAMAIASADGGSQIGEMLRRNANGLTVEPLSVAIRLLSGEYPLVAKEILEVARDIVRRSVASEER